MCPFVITITTIKSYLLRSPTKKNNAHISISYIANKNWNHPCVPNGCDAFGKENNGPRSKHGPRSSVYLGEAERGMSSGTMGIQGLAMPPTKRGLAKGWGGDRCFFGSITK